MSRPEGQTAEQQPEKAEKSESAEVATTPGSGVSLRPSLLNRLSSSRRRPLAPSTSGPEKRPETETKPEYVLTIIFTILNQIISVFVLFNIGI
jgi:hypothetical protein